MQTKLAVELLHNGPLSPAEARCFKEWLTGDLHKQIAGRLCIAVDTFETHLQRIKQKLEVRNACVALKVAEGRGMVRVRIVRTLCLVLMLASVAQYDDNALCRVNGRVRVSSGWSRRELLV